MAIYKHSRGVERWTTEKQLQLVARAGFEPGQGDRVEIQRPKHSAMLPFYSMKSVKSLKLGKDAKFPFVK